MANELLDFVMSLVRDPDAAARYHADPAQAIADAHLSGVTSADVGNLLPMVSDSMAMANPVTHASADWTADWAADGMAGRMAAPSSPEGASVWNSGAATAAFDAFTPHAAARSGAADHQGAPVVIDRGPVLTGAGADAGAGSLSQFNADIGAPVGFEAPPGHLGAGDPGPGHGVDSVDGGWGTGEHDGSVSHESHHPGHTGFDHFS